MTNTTQTNEPLTITHHCDECGAQVEESCEDHPGAAISSIASHLYNVYRTGEDETDQELVGVAVSLDAAVLLAHREHAHQIQLGEDGPVINVQPGNWIQHRQ